MLGRIFGRKRKEEVQEVAEVQPEQEVSAVAPQEVEEKEEERPLLPAELETFKKAMGITPHNYWTWAARTNNFKLMTDGRHVWVEGYKEHIGKQLPMTQQKAWSWEFLRERLTTFG